ncbi:hypothetical protein O0536_25600, partial [Brevibacillus laterosporus]|uniref:hypothetical protein n=1 Tax=Brevibacillus laterosporus TaxID=1465 RepID=UPI0022A70464
EIWHSSRFAQQPGTYGCVVDRGKLRHRWGYQFGSNDLGMADGVVYTFWRRVTFRIVRGYLCRH